MTQLRACATVPDESCGGKLDDYLKSHKVSRRSLASATGLDLRTVSAICTGKRSGNMATWLRIARALRCTIDDILEG